MKHDTYEKEDYHCSNRCHCRYHFRQAGAQGLFESDGRRFFVWGEFFMIREKKTGKGLFVFLCIIIFFISFVGSMVFKAAYKPWAKDYAVVWTDEIGKIYTDLSYGEGEAHKFDLYVPADDTKESYGLVVYLHAGGFTTGDKADDKEMLQWLCSKGYVAAGINYSLKNEENPTASVYSQSEEIKASIPFVVEEAGKLGYQVDRMAISGGSAGGCLALLYAYRDADTSPVPVKMVFEAVGPASFYAEDWAIYGLDKSPEAAAGLFGIMAGKEIKPEMLGTPEYEDAVKDISAYMWVNENTVPTVCAYGVYDKVCPFDSSKHLKKALEENNVIHDYIEFPHSGHALQNDDKCYIRYMDKVVEYLDTYMMQ